MENPPLIDDFPIKTSIDGWFSREPRLITFDQVLQGTADAEMLSSAGGPVHVMSAMPAAWILAMDEL
jgi:hypothetical protein